MCQNISYRKQSTLPTEIESYTGKYQHNIVSTAGPWNDQLMYQLAKIKS